MVVKNKRSVAVLIAVFAAFVVVAFLAHGSISTLFSHSDKDEESLNAWQLQHQEKLQELLRLETAGALQMKSVQQEMQVLQQQNLQLRASLKAASARASTSLERGAGSREKPALELTSTPKQRKWLGPPKAPPSTAKTGNFQRTWAPATKSQLPPIYHSLPQSETKAFEDTCSKFRKRVPYDLRILGVAGLFNTGTNMLAALLDYNCNFMSRLTNVDGGSLGGYGPVLWQVPWGKHKPNSWRGRVYTGANTGMWTTQTGHSADDVLPVVIVKDPLTWFQSMCRERYDVLGPWFRKQGISKKCPELLDHAKTAVDVGWADGNHSAYDSILDLWSTWHRDYADLPEPPIFVRFEDLLYDPASFVEPICKCAGGTVTHPIHIMTDNVKTKTFTLTVGHGSTAERYADADKRMSSYTAQDLDFIRGHPEGRRMMEKFGYFV